MADIKIPAKITGIRSAHILVVAQAGDDDTRPTVLVTLRWVDPYSIPHNAVWLRLHPQEARDFAAQLVRDADEADRLDNKDDAPPPPSDFDADADYTVRRAGKIVGYMRCDFSKSDAPILTSAEMGRWLKIPYRADHFGGDATRTAIAVFDSDEIEAEIEGAERPAPTDFNDDDLTLGTASDITQ